MLFKGFASITVYPVAGTKAACCTVSALEQSKFCSIAKIASGPERILTSELATLRHSRQILIPSKV